MTRGTVVSIVGPTATGKTAVGMDLARRLDGEIISADSMAVYKLMNIGTAKPTPEEQAAVRFHLIDVVYPDEPFSVAEFKRLAQEAIADIVSRGKMPIVVGGTGLYIKALTGRLNIPAVGPDRKLREVLHTQARERGGEHLLDELRKVDPDTAVRLHPKDTKRIVRALEVHRLTGLPISHFHRTAGTHAVGYEIRQFGLRMSRPALYARINERVEQQVQSGLVEEVRSLMAKGYSPDLPSMRGLDYRQIGGYLLGQYDFATAVELLKRDTRRYAKRQFTWFNADPGVIWIDVEGRDPSEVGETIIAHLGA